MKFKKSINERSKLVYINSTFEIIPKFYLFFPVRLVWYIYSSSNSKQTLVVFIYKSPFEVKRKGWLQPLQSDLKRLSHEDQIHAIVTVGPLSHLLDVCFCNFWWRMPTKFSRDFVYIIPSNNSSCAYDNKINKVI